MVELSAYRFGSKAAVMMILLAAALIAATSVERSSVASHELCGYNGSTQQQLARAIKRSPILSRNPPIREGFDAYATADMMTIVEVARRGARPYPAITCWRGIIANDGSLSYTRETWCDDAAETCRIFEADLHNKDEAALSIMRALQIYRTREKSKSR